MKIALVTSFVVLALPFASGCSKSSKSPDSDTATTSAATVAKANGAIKGSCNLRKEASTCSEETEKSDAMGLAKGLCDALKGTWSDQPCPKGDNAVGTCADKDGSVTVYYADGDAPRDLDDAKSSCEILNEGKFTALASAPKTASEPAPKPAPAVATKKPTPAKK